MSYVCAELEDNLIDSWECTKCKGVSRNLCSDNMAALCLQRDIPNSNVYYNQACMMSMDQSTAMNGNEETVVIYSTIEFYYNWFKEIHARNKGIKNVV